MMTVTLRIALILVSVGTLFLMMRKIRQSKVQIESAIFWIVLALVLVLFSIFPAVADFIAYCLGVYSTANFLFLFAIFVLIVKVFYMTIHVSQLESKIKDLVQQMALDEKRAEDQKKELEARMALEAEKAREEMEAREKGQALKAQAQENKTAKQQKKIPRGKKG